MRISADSARRPIHWMIAEGARRPLRGLSGPPVSDLATQDHSARSGQLAEVAAGVGVIDDSIGGCAFAQPGYPQVRTCRPGTCADGQLGRHSRAGQSADLAGHPAARPRVGTGQKNHPRFGGCGGQLAMQCAPARYHCLRGLSGRWRTRASDLVITDKVGPVTLCQEETDCDGRVRVCVDGPRCQAAPGLRNLRLRATPVHGPPRAACQVDG